MNANERTPNPTHGLTITVSLLARLLSSVCVMAAAAMREARVDYFRGDGADKIGGEQGGAPRTGVGRQ